MRPEYVVKRSDFPYYAIEFVAEGSGLLTLNGQQYELTAGTVFAYGPGVQHHIRSSSSQVMRKYYLDFVGIGANELLIDSSLIIRRKSYTSFVVSRVHELTELFELLIRNGNESSPLTSAVCRSLTELLFLKIQQTSLPRERAMPQAYATYDRIRRCIDEQFLKLNSAQDIAKECNITPVHLSRLFGRFSNCGAYQYLLQRKMNYAAGLLMNEGLLVKEVAYRLGYADPFRFSRSFKRVYGIPPKQLVSTSRS